MFSLVYLPIEIKHRELPSRLLMAHYLLHAGYAVVIGNQWSLSANHENLAEGLFLFKSMNAVQARSMATARKAGHVIVASDEGALGAVDEEGFLREVTNLAAENCDLFLSQSPTHADIVERKFPGLRGRVHVVGNPRLELFLPELRHVLSDPRTQALRPYLLFVTNYGTINSLWAGERDPMEIAQLSGAFDGPERESKMRNFSAALAWERTNYQALLDVAKWTARHVKGLNIIVLPDPGERPYHWEHAMAGLPNVTVVSRSDPHPWIANAALVVHTGSAAVVEAVLLDTPVLNLLPQDHPCRGLLVTHLNPTVRTAPDAIAAIYAFFTSRSGPIPEFRGKAESALHKYMPATRDKTAAAFANIMIKELSARGAVPAPAGGHPIPPRGSYKRCHRSDADTDNFTTDKSEITAWLGLIAGISGAAPGFTVSELDESVYLIAPTP